MKTPIYSDLDLSLTVNALTGDVAAVVDAAAVRRCILRVVKLRRFDIPYEPNKSAWIDEFLFDSVNVATAAAILDRLTFALNKIEPRATYVVTVDPGADTLAGSAQGYDITVKFTVKTLMISGDVKYFLERVR